jgi:hypothetical protein
LFQSAAKQNGKAPREQNKRQTTMDWERVDSSSCIDSPPLLTPQEQKQHKQRQLELKRNTARTSIQNKRTAKNMSPAPSPAPPSPVNTPFPQSALRLPRLPGTPSSATRQLTKDEKEQLWKIKEAKEKHELDCRDMIAKAAVAKAEMIAKAALAARDNTITYNDEFERKILYGIPLSPVLENQMGLSLKHPSLMMDPPTTPQPTPWKASPRKRSATSTPTSVKPSTDLSPPMMSSPSTLPPTTRGCGSLIWYVPRLAPRVVPRFVYLASFRVSCLSPYVSLTLNRRSMCKQFAVRLRWRVRI